ncbi:MAG: putative glycosyltransferase [Myxococcaceae bacterium]|nr:putative glycosyltransferase [Myxococcaceae bacterium]
MRRAQYGLSAARDSNEPCVAPVVASVAVRSYRRVPQLLELLERLTKQDYPSFEVVVIEQSEFERQVYRAELSRFERDPRVRILRYPALGAGAARIEAARQCRGEVIVFMDDDDLPLRDDWLTSFMRNFDDPLCMAVSGRQVFALGEDPSVHDTARNRKLCLRYSFLRMPRGRMRHTQRIQGVTQVAGGNAAIRASAIERAGGWDEEDDHDEDSFNFRFAQVRRPGEYFAYDPEPAMLRRFDVAGGLARRQQTLAERIRAELRYSHRVVRKYYPGRFYALYPCYLALAAMRALNHVRESQPQLALSTLLLELAVLGPKTYVSELAAMLPER